MSNLITNDYQMHGIYRAKLIVDSNSDVRAYIPGISNVNVFKKEEGSDEEVLDTELFEKMKTSFPIVNWCIYTMDAKGVPKDGELAWVMFENSNVEYPVVINYIVNKSITQVIIPKSDTEPNNPIVSGGTAWPVGNNNAQYTSRHNPPKHYGVDIAVAGTDAYSTPIYAAFAGTVKISMDKYYDPDNPEHQNYTYYGRHYSLSSGTFDGKKFVSYGRHVVIESVVNGTTYYVYYAHLNERSVNVGDQVVAGQQIGYMGTTGNSSGPHLHLEFYNSTGTARVDVDPSQFFPK